MQSNCFIWKYKGIRNFVNTVFHSSLLAVAKHARLSHHITIDWNHNSIRDLISLLSLHINEHRIYCFQCCQYCSSYSMQSQKNEQSLSVDLFYMSIIWIKNTHRCHLNRIYIPMAYAPFFSVARVYINISQERESLRFPLIIFEKSQIRIVTFAFVAWN